MKRRLLELTGLLLVLAFVALLVVASGIVPVKASLGHLEVTRQVLSFAMRRSVETHALGVRPPDDLDDTAMAVRGAGHYERGCQPCHGAPGAPASPILQELTPRPPELGEAVTHWEPAQLFEIVKHGVKMTGMPAWPAPQRDDEVWAIVSFLRRLPGMDADRYRRLAGTDTPGNGGGAISRLEGDIERVVGTCAQCHGADGLGRGVGAFPRLAGQSRAYLVASLEAYRHETRFSGIMEPLAVSMDSAMIQRVARHYADSRAAAEGDTTAAPGVLRQGEAIARDGIGGRKIAACTECHGPADRPRNPYYPELAGQYADYMELQLRLFREDRRGGFGYRHVMSEVAHDLEPAEARAVAAWYASLPWNPADPGTTLAPEAP